MPLETLIYCIGSGILALFVALFQYRYKTKRNRLYWALAGLRFITLFSLLLLIINPKFEKKQIQIIKPTLAIAVDNSQSIRYLNKDSIASNAAQILLDHTTLNSKYDVQLYRFGNQLHQNSTLTFEDTQTNITKSIQDIEVLNDSEIAPIVLISDGNQTRGNDYQFASKQFNQVVFPVILGDSIYHTDIKIQNINVNTYTYLNSKFPVEIMASYTGNTAVDSELIIRSNGRLIHKERVQFSAARNSVILSPKIKSTKVGLERYDVSLTPIENEKNTVNNQKTFAIETIDEYTKIALISLLSHPDLGAIKAAIETNEKRLVTLLSPSEFIATNEAYGMVILYQPNQRFKAVFDFLNKRKLNTFIIGGTQTQWTFLNSIQSDYKQDLTGQNENVQGTINPNFNNFSLTDFSFEGYPPLTAEFGGVSINVPHESLMFKSINGSTTKAPLWFTYEKGSRRTAVLLAENLWKWRMHSFREQQNFETFDAFISKLIQYLNIQNQKNRLLVNYEPIYDGSQPLEISAQFFNKNYELETNAEVFIALTERRSGRQLNYPMVPTQNSYKVNLNALEPGDYSFEVIVNGGTHRSFGAIEILNFNIEQQFINANVQQLEQLAINTDGQAYFDTQIDNLASALISDNRFRSIQKITKKTVPLISIKFYLLLLLLSLAIEWLIRKYNGFI